MERRLAALGLVALAVAGAACDGARPAVAPGDDAARREELRDALRAELGAQYDAPVAAGSGDDLRKGAQIYDQLCRACHGAGGKGNGPSAEWLRPRPASLVDPATAAFFSDRAQLRIIETGVPGTAMVGWADVLDAADRRNVFLHIRSMRAD
jgi:high-affinity iron transporter